MLKQALKLEATNPRRPSAIKQRVLDLTKRQNLQYKIGNSQDQNKVGFLKKELKALDNRMNDISIMEIRRQRAKMKPVKYFLQDEPPAGQMLSTPPSHSRTITPPSSSNSEKATSEEIETPTSNSCSES